MIEGLQNCITFMCLYLPIQACESLMRHIVVCAQSVRIEKYQCVCHCNITTQSYGAHKRCHFVKMMTLFVTPVSRCTVGVDGQKVRHSKALELRNRSYNTDLKSPYLKSRDAGSNPSLNPPPHTPSAPPTPTHTPPQVPPPHNPTPQPLPPSCPCTPATQHPYPTPTPQSTP